MSRENESRIMREKVLAARAHRMMTGKDPRGPRDYIGELASVKVVDFSKLPPRGKAEYLIQVATGFK